jgi:hypothetical protein
MRQAFVSTLVLIAFLLNPASGRKKQLQDRTWQTGKVLDTQRSDAFAGTVNRPGVVLTNGRRITNDKTKAVYRTEETIVIEGATHTYTVSKLLAKKPVKLTVNGSVRFAVEDTVLYLIDDDFIEQKTEIVKRVLRQTTEQEK